MSEENFKTDVAVEKITQLPNDVYESGLKGEFAAIFWFGQLNNLV